MKSVRSAGEGPIRGHHVGVLALLLAMTAAEESRAQEAAEEAYDLPPIEVVVSPPVPPKKKYPNVTVAKKKPTAAARPTPPPAAPASDGGVTPAGTESFDGLQIAIPGIAVVGDIIPLGPHGTWELDGSGQVVTGEELYTSHVFNTAEALRKVTGVNVRDEEGFGLRPNIGIRGLNPTRSTKVLLLEDGVFLGYAPYGENASYFHPLMDRYDRVEVIKGADMLLYGPQTISGTINYVTPDPPRMPAGFAAVTAGNRDYLNGQVFYGGWQGNIGGLVDYVHKQGNGARDNTDHYVTDFGMKLIALNSANSAWITKLSYFTEDSTVTYSGITDAERRRFGLRYNPFKNDTFDTSRYAASVVNSYDFNQNINFRSTFYYNTFARDWWRQSSRTTDTQCGNIFRDTRLDGGRVNPDKCDSIRGASATTISTASRRG